MLLWDLYDVTSARKKLNNIKFRGKLRLFALQRDGDLLVENTLEKDMEIDLVCKKTRNTVHSKLKVNDRSRYE